MYWSSYIAAVEKTTCVIMPQLLKAYALKVWATVSSVDCWLNIMAVPDFKWKSRLPSSCAPERVSYHSVPFGHQLLHCSLSCRQKYPTSLSSSNNLKFPSSYSTKPKVKSLWAMHSILNIRKMLLRCFYIRSIWFLLNVEICEPRSMCVTKT
jgi:hypothetical protein